MHVATGNNLMFLSEFVMFSANLFGLLFSERCPRRVAAAGVGPAHEAPCHHGDGWTVAVQLALRLCCSFTGGDVLAARRTAGWKGWMMGGKFGLMRGVW